jgi:hypothetical protein
VSNDNASSFEKLSLAPIVGRSAVDPYLAASPSVLVDNGSWRMWYVSGTGWESTKAGPNHRYHIKYAESLDGINWTPTGHTCIDYQDESETAIARPCVVKDGSLYRMWYCSRGAAYRIGYAESSDGLDWQRKDDEIDIAPSADGWDREMQAYPFVFDHGADRHMLYNGNGFGATGIGHLVLDTPIQTADTTVVDPTRDPASQ